VAIGGRLYRRPKSILSGCLIVQTKWRSNAITQYMHHVHFTLEVVKKAARRWELHSFMDTRVLES